MIYIFKQKTTAKNILQGGNILQHKLIKEKNFEYKQLSLQDLAKNLSLIFYFIFWLLKPFYILDSGSLQIGDLFLGIGFIMGVVANNFTLKVNQIDKFFYLFLCSVIIINFTYSLLIAENSFLKAILYYIFNFMVVYLFREFMDNEEFYKKFSVVLKLNILIQFALLFAGVGEWFYGGARYVGTYNDPNQFAFGILSTYCMLFCLSRKITVKRLWVYFLLSVYLIYQSSSTGMLMGITILFVCEQYFKIFAIKDKFDKYLYAIYLFVITFVFAFLCVELIKILSGGSTDIFFLKRIYAKLNKGDSFIQSFIEDRNLYAFVNSPFTIFYGGGETQMARFGAPNNGELHSTWLGFLFYYGIIPFSFVIAWIKNNLKNIDLYLVPVYLCIFIEAFTLINHRQPSFWTLIILASVIKREKQPEKRIHKYDKIQYNRPNIQR